MATNIDSEIETGLLNAEISRITADRNKLRAENDTLRKDIALLSEKVDELQEAVSANCGIDIDGLKARMFDALQTAACTDLVKGDALMHMVYGFDCLLNQLEG